MIVVTSLLGVVACGGPDPQPVPDTDVCALLTAQEVLEYFPDGHLPTTGLEPHREDSPLVARCVWGNPSEARAVALSVIEGNAADIIVRTSDQVEPVAQRKAFVRGSSELYCNLYVETPSGLVGFDAQPSKTHEDPCEAAADTLTTVLERMG